LPTKAHLLIVDDEANTLASLSRAFRLAGHEATVCDNAAKALELAKAQLAVLRRRLSREHF
jgi:DNA-binding NtrC family response regulator